MKIQRVLFNKSKPVQSVTLGQTGTNQEPHQLTASQRIRTERKQDLGSTRVSSKKGEGGLSDWTTRVFQDGCVGSQGFREISEPGFRKG
jgi:hypothetical protein